MICYTVLHKIHKHNKTKCEVYGDLFNSEHEAMGFIQRIAEKIKTDEDEIVVNYKVLQKPGISIKRLGRTIHKLTIHRVVFHEPTVGQNQ